jgi:DNA-binding response OmpR family regulator
MAAIQTTTVPALAATEIWPATRRQRAELPVRALSVSEHQTNQKALRRMLGDTPWQLLTATTCRMAEQKLRGSAILVVFCESSLPDGSWKDVLEMISQLEEPPLLVVTSRLADDLLWSEVLNLGGYDVILTPYVEDEVRRLLTSVWTRHFNLLPKVRAVSAAG